MRPRLHHVDGIEKKVLRKTLGAFKVRLVCQKPFPTEMEEVDLQDETWKDVCMDLGVNASITDDYHLTVCWFTECFGLCGAVWYTIHRLGMVGHRYMVPWLRDVGHTWGSLGTDSSNAILATHARYNSTRNYLPCLPRITIIHLWLWQRKPRWRTQLFLSQSQL